MPRKIQPWASYRSYGRQTGRDFMRKGRGSGYSEKASGGRRTRYRRKWLKAGRRRAKRYTSKAKKLTRKVNLLEARQKANMGELIYRDSLFDEIICMDNEKNTAFVAMNQISFIEAAIENLKFFDPANPATFLTVDFSSGTQHKDIQIGSSTLKCQLRANYLTEISYCIYLCVCRNETDTDPKVAMGLGIGDVSNAGVNSTLIYPTDIPLVTDLWNLSVKKKGVLRPGDMVTVSHSVNQAFSYDPSYVDVSDQPFQHLYKCYGFLVHYWGGLGHGSNQNETGIVNSRADIVSWRTMKVHYNAGADIKFLQVLDGANTMAGSTYTNLREAINQQPTR